MEDTNVHGYTKVNMLTAILLGKRGCDKALIGNTMLGNACFSPQTSTCKLVVYQEEGQICDIINTPDLYHGPKPDSKEEMLPQTKLFYSGERVFLLILQHNNISLEEITMFAKLKETYGETIVDRVIVVLDISKASQQEMDQDIQRILDECGWRVCFFNREMKKDELNDQLLSTFKRILQKNALGRLGTTSVDPCDKTSENEKSQPEAAEAGAAVPEVKMKMADDKLCNTTDESREKHAAAVPEEQKSSPVLKERKMQPTVQESLERSNRLHKGLQDRKAQHNLPDEKAGAAAPEVKMIDNRIYETINESKNSSYEALGKGSHYTKGTEKKRPPAVPTSKPPTVVVQCHTGMDVLTIVLLGQTGSGKSATGNTILARRRFESHASSAPVTQRCEVAEGIVCGIKVRVIDTPDFFDADLENPKIHIQTCKDLCQVQPVVYLLVMHMGRFTEGEREAVSNMQRTFGEQVVRQTVVLFTGKEKLREMSLYDYIKNADPQLHQLVQTFGLRIYAFNNNDKRHYQVKELVKILMKMPIGDRIKEQYNRYKAELKECTVL